MGRKSRESGGLSGTETRERILETAIDLFYAKGFSAVSIREIAAAVGIKGASIYNHFEGKDDILEAILTRHKELASGVFGSEPGIAPAGADTQNPETGGLPFEKTLETAMSQGLRFMGAPGMDKIFGILSREQLNNERIRHFFLEEYIEAPRAVFAKFFSAVIAAGELEPADPDRLAGEFHAFIMYKYYENYLLRRDESIDPSRMAEEFRGHIEFFCAAVRRTSAPRATAPRTAVRRTAVGRKK